MKYEVGDRIRIVKKGPYWNSAGKMDHLVGKTVVIADIDEYSPLLIGIRDEPEAEGAGGMWWLREDEIELVDEPRFKTVDLSDPCERKRFMKKMETAAFKSKHIVVAKMLGYGEFKYYILKDVDLKCSSRRNPDYAFMSLRNSFTIWEDPGELEDLISRTRSDIDTLYVLDSLSDLKQLLIDEGV